MVRPGEDELVVGCAGLGAGLGATECQACGSVGLGDSEVRSDPVRDSRRVGHGVFS